MDRRSHAARFSRRSLLKAGGGVLAAATVAPHLGTGTATAQTPKRGGTLSLRLWDPPHFDPHLTISYKINVLYTFTHSRLLKHKAGAGVTPGTYPIEGDLADLDRHLRPERPRPEQPGRECSQQDERRGQQERDAS